MIHKATSIIRDIPSEQSVSATFIVLRRFSYVDKPCCESCCESIGQYHNQTLLDFHCNCF